MPLRPEAERAAADALAAGDHARAAEVVLTAYGPEIFGWLHAVDGSIDRAEEAFSRFSALLWASLPRFRGDSALRTWAYAIARHAHLQEQRVERRARRADLDEAPLSALEARVRTETRPHLRTEAKDHLAAARARLDPEDRALLVLRVDRGMSWAEVAQVLGAAPADTARRAAQLRKRFERLKDALRATAEREGWLPRADDDG